MDLSIFNSFEAAFFGMILSMSLMAHAIACYVMCLEYILHGVKEVENTKLFLSYASL